MRRNHAERNNYGMSAVGNELRDVTRIMMSNIDDVIHRGEALNSKFWLVSLPIFYFSVLETRASDLSHMSKKYREDARQLNRRSAMVKLFLGMGIAGK
jgi:vesicle transport protein SEC22